MNMESAVDVVRESMTVMLMLAAPVLVAGLVVGLVISIMQAVTQVQEQTLTFVPKLVAQKMHEQLRG